MRWIPAAGIEIGILAPGGWQGDALLPRGGSAVSCMAGGKMQFCGEKIELLFVGRNGVSNTFLTTGSNIRISCVRNEWKGTQYGEKSIGGAAFSGV